MEWSLPEPMHYVCCAQQSGEVELQACGAQKMVSEDQMHDAEGVTYTAVFAFTLFRLRLFSGSSLLE